MGTVNSDDHAVRGRSGATEKAERHNIVEYR